MQDFSGIDALRWLQEVEYNVNHFAKYLPVLRERLGFLCVANELNEARDMLEGWQERAVELANAIGHLQSLIGREEGRNG